MEQKNNLETATFAGGCFWCTEALFKRLKGVDSVKSGYTGGEKENPSYEEVTTGSTGHAEAIQILFDPAIIPYEKLLDVFWRTHNPTTMNQQGADIGTQYRSSIFYLNDEQKKTALKSRTAFEKEKVYGDPIVTEILPLKNFYPAEDYHQNFYDSNKFYPYCTFVIDPKIQKLMKEFRKDLKDKYKES